MYTAVMVGVERFAVSVRAVSGLAQVTVLNDGFFFRAMRGGSGRSSLSSGSCLKSFQIWFNSSRTCSMWCCR